MTTLETWLKIVAEYAPMILALIPGFPAAIAPFVATAIQAAETIPGATGQTKLTAATNIAIAGLNIAKQVGAPIDVAVETQALQQGISAVVQAVNGFTRPPAAPTNLIA